MRVRGTIAGRVALPLAALVGMAVVVFAFGAPREHCPTVTVDSLRSASSQAVDWFVRNQNDDGSWLYEYDRDSDVATDDYNLIRHSGVIQSLYVAASYGIEGALDSADRGMAFVEQRLVDGQGWVAFAEGNTASVGANALLIAGLAERRLLTGDDRYDDLLDGLGAMLAAQTEPGGAVLARFDFRTGAPVPGEYSIYYTGEAYWALARLHNYDPSAGWDTLADQVGHYVATDRDQAEDIWPPLADHWAGYGLAETVTFPDRPAGRPLTDDEAAYTRRQAGQFSIRVRSVSQGVGTWGSIVRPGATLRGGGYGVIGEGLTGLWRAAMADERLADLRRPVAERATCIAALGIVEQVDADEATEFTAPTKVQGAWFIDGVTRMDDQQHALSALLRTIDIVQAGTLPGAGDGSDLPAWIWVAVVALALNPFRNGVAVPRAERSHGERTRLALVGALIGAVPVLVAGALSGAVLDLAGVSASSLRIAIGGVALLGAASDVLRPRVDPEPGLPGWKAALVPVAVPLVARPPLVLIALSAVADQHLGVVVGGLAIGIAAFVGVARFAKPSGVTGRSLRWLGRADAMVLALLAVFLIADGVLGV